MPKTLNVTTCPLRHCRCEGVLRKINSKGWHFTGTKCGTKWVSERRRKPVIYADVQPEG